MKKFICTFYISIFLVTLIVCACSRECVYAYNSSISQNSCSFKHGGFNSYAWNERYLFAAIGKFFFTEECQVTWTAPHYTIYRVDKTTGDVRLLIRDFPHQYIKLMIENDKLFILYEYSSDISDLNNLWKNIGYQQDSLEIDEDRSSGNVYLVTLDLNGAILDAKTFKLNDRIGSALIINSILYITTESAVFSIDTNTNAQYTVYRGTHINNSTYTCNAIVENNTLCIVDDRKIVSVNIYTGDSRILCDFDPIVYSPIYQQYDYLVLNNILYYWNESSKEMCALNLNNYENISLSRDRYFFHQVSEDGILTTKIKEENLLEKNSMHVLRDVEGTLFVEGIPFEEKELFSFTNESLTLISSTIYEFPASSRIPILINNKQYIEERNFREFFYFKFPINISDSIKSLSQLSTRLWEN